MHHPIPVTGVWGKQFACIFCKKLVCKLVPHLLKLHKDESIVKEIAALPERDPERQRKISQVRSQGSFLHNNEVLSSKQETIIIKKTSRLSSSPSRLAPCVYCGDGYAKNFVYKHHKRCHQRGKDNRKTIPLKSNLMASTPEEIHRQLFGTEILGKLKGNDNVSCVIKTDQMLK